MDPWTPIISGAATHVAGKLIEDPSLAVTLWNRVMNTLFRRRSRIAFTGMAGVGKTVLFDYLTGAAYDPNYCLPGPSLEGEDDDKHTSQGKRIIMVVPGDPDSPQRADRLSAAFSGRKPVDGVVHVVANGYAEIRGEGVTEQLVRQGYSTIDQVREFQRQQEIEDLSEVIGYMRQNARKSAKPQWMLVAATKLDLYPSDVASSELYYAADEESPFVSALNGLRAELGSLNFRWQSLPVCGVLDDYHYNGQTQKSEMSETERNRLVVAFDTALDAYAAL